MEFTLTISQKQIHENFPTLDIKDAAIIDFLGKFSHECDKKVYGKTVYYWFAYSKICDECPLLRLDPESVRRRMRGLCSLNILAAHPENRGGKVFFAFGEKYSLTHRDKSSKGRAENPEVEKRSGGKSRPLRAENPELMAKGRANLTDNHNNHLDHNNQSSTESEIDAAAGVKIELHSDDLDGLKLLDFFPSEQKKENPSQIPPPPSQTARPAPGESAPRRWDVFDIDSEAAALKIDPLAAERFARETGTTAAQMYDALASLVDTFTADQKSTGYNYPNRMEFRKHFFNLVRKKQEIKRNTPAASAPGQSSTKATLNRFGGDASKYEETPLF